MGSSGRSSSSSLVVVALGLVYVKYRSDVNAKQDELTTIQNETAVVQAKIAELSPYAVLQAQRTAMTADGQGHLRVQRALLDPAAGAEPRHPRERPPAVAHGDGPAGHAAGRRRRRTRRGAAAATTDVVFTGQTEKHRDVAEFLTRLGLIPQLKGITLTSSTDTASTGPTGTTTASYKAFTVTAALRPYTTAPPTTQLQAVAP